MHSVESDTRSVTLRSASLRQRGSGLTPGGGPWFQDRWRRRDGVFGACSCEKELSTRRQPTSKSTCRESGGEELLGLSQRSRSPIAARVRSQAWAERAVGRSASPRAARQPTITTAQKRKSFAPNKSPSSANASVVRGCESATMGHAVAGGGTERAGERVKSGAGAGPPHDGLEVGSGLSSEPRGGLPTCHRQDGGVGGEERAEEGAHHPEQGRGENADEHPRGARLVDYRL